MTFQKLVERIANAKTYEDVMDCFYSRDGVDMSFQKEKISYKKFEILSNLVNNHYAMHEEGH